MSTDPSAAFFYGFTQERDEWNDFVARNLQQVHADGLMTPEQRALFNANVEQAKLAKSLAVSGTQRDDDETDDEDDDGEDDDGSTDDDGTWEDYHGLKAEEERGIDIGLIGYDGHLGHYLAIRESLVETEWADIADIDPSTFVVKPDWEARLRAVIEEWGLNVHESKPGWHLVSLYF